MGKKLLLDIVPHMYPKKIIASKLQSKWQKNLAITYLHRSKDENNFMSTEVLLQVPIIIIPLQSNIPLFFFLVIYLIDKIQDENNKKLRVMKEHPKAKDYKQK